MKLSKIVKTKQKHNHFLQLWKLNLKSYVFAHEKLLVRVLGKKIGGCRS